MSEEVGVITELNDYGYATYLIGSMEKTALGDDGGGMRIAVEKALLERNVFPINPVKLESSKTGLSTSEVKEKLIGWVASGNWDKFKEMAIEIWHGRTEVSSEGALYKIPGDIDYVKMSDWLTMTYNKGDHPCGTFFECGIALERGIPIYLITNMAKKELPMSLLQGITASGGVVFGSLTDYLAFIDKEYNLKVK